MDAPTPSPRNALRSPALWQGVAIGLVILFVAARTFDVRITRKSAPASAPTPAQAVTVTTPTDDIAALRAAVLPVDGIELPIAWGDLGPRLAATGALDRAAFDALYDARGGLSPEVRALLDGTLTGTVRMTETNAGELLNVLWAFGLANTNRVLTEGPMVDPRYGGAQNFASTGGWTLAAGNGMDHYSAHALVTLTDEQQALVERVSQGIYRPCCGNSTYFPDCNHGMAMLGLLELLAAAGIPEDAMFNIALQVNAYWFPQTYLTIARYKATQGTAWADVDAKEVLGDAFSSARGYRTIASQVAPLPGGGGGSCGI